RSVDAFDRAANADDFLRRCRPRDAEKSEAGSGCKGTLDHIGHDDLPDYRNVLWATPCRGDYSGLNCCRVATSRCAYSALMPASSITLRQRSSSALRYRSSSAGGCATM